MNAQLEVILVGVIATVVLDLWLLLLKHGLRGPTTDWAMVGRWFGHMPRGVFVHQAIGNSAPIRHELAIGWTAHYVIGVAYSYLYLHALMFFSVPISLHSAIAFGLITVVAAWFILQPGLGVGVFASRLPKPWQARALNLCAHFFFGCGLYLGWWLFGHG